MGTTPKYFILYEVKALLTTESVLGKTGTTHYPVIKFLIMHLNLTEVLFKCEGIIILD